MRFDTCTVDVERHARDFMEAAKKLQLYFVGLQHEDQPTREELLKKVYSLYLASVDIKINLEIKTKLRCKN